MKTSKSVLFPTLVAGAIFSLALPSADGAITTWGGSNGEYTVGANWVGGSVPVTNTTNTAEINSGNVNYTPGGDILITNGGMLQINGGSWTQSGGGAWIQLGGGTLHVNGGTFNQGSAGNINRNSTSAVLVSSGVANFAGNYVYDSVNTGSFTISGGTVNIANEFKPLTTFNMTTGILNANLISFADGPGSINFSGGLVSVNGAGPFSGFYGGGTKSLNFTSGSSGSLFFSSYTLADLTADGFLTNGTIRYNGAIDGAQFNAYESGGGVYVSAVPEPSVVALACAGLGTALFFRRRIRA